MKKLSNKLKSLFHINAAEDKVIKKALACLEEKLTYSAYQITDCQTAQDYLRIQLAQEKSEVFAVLFLTHQHRLLTFEKLFCGTISYTNVYPRKVVQRALALNAAAVIFAHNHPSGEVIPSQADRELTEQLKSILAIVNVTVLDHFIVTHHGAYSFAQHHLL